MKKFKDFPDFTPNVTPKDVFKKGSFGGTYYRDIYSSITGKSYKGKATRYLLFISVECLFLFVRIHFYSEDDELVVFKETY